MAKILFSPVGGSDPIRNGRDGSMLHICRIYKPDRVVLYLTGEMCRHREQDDRYRYCLKKLGEKLSHEFEIEEILDNITEVQEYDYFYDKFRQYINDITAKMEEGDELLLNVSSGTPAMKSALYVLSTLAEFRFKSIQVSTPEKGENPPKTNNGEGGWEEEWEHNEDNRLDQEKESRCVEPESRNLVKLLKVNIIEKHLRSFDYTAALEVAKELEKHISPKAMTMLEQANERIQLNTECVNQIAKKIGYQPMPDKTKENCDLLEYILLLKLKVERGEYADFIRAITPAVFELFYRILKVLCDIDIADYCVGKKSSGLKWDEEKLKDTEVEKILRASYSEFRVGPVYSAHLKPLIKHFSKDQDVTEMVEDLRNTEEKARNKAAHTIVPITDERVSSWTGHSAEELLEEIQELTLLVVPGQDESIWDSYERMNDEIMKEINLDQWPVMGSADKEISEK